MLRRASPDHPAAPVTAVAITVVVWGLVSPLIKSASVTGTAMSFYRLAIGAGALLVIVALTRRSLREALWPWGLMAGLLFGVNLLFFVTSIKETTVANATLIGALQPAIVILVAGPLFGEVVTGRDVAFVGAAIAGVVIVIAASAGSPEWHPLGDALAVGAVLTYTAYFLVSKRVRTGENSSTLEYITVVHVIAALVVTPIALLNPSDLGNLDGRDIATILFFALISGTLGQFVIGWAHRFVDVSLSSLMMLGVPVVASITAWAMLDESLSLLQIGGGAITLAAIGAMVVRRPASSSPVEEAIGPIATAAD